MKTAVIIPTFNEAKEIGRLLRELKVLDLDCLVVDDGSTDTTARIAEEHGAVVLRNPSNQGKGASLSRGFQFAVDKSYDAVITMDGDGQHLPQDIPHFLEAAQMTDSQIYIGNRMEKTQSMPWVRIMTNRFMSSLISFLAHQEIPDTQCGFRLIKRELLEKVNLSTSKYESESEILLQAARQGYKIQSVAIKTIYSNETSRINPFIDTLRFFRFILRELWIMLP